MLHSCRKRKKVTEQFFGNLLKTPQNGQFWHKNARQAKTKDSINMKLCMSGCIDTCNNTSELEKNSLHRSRDPAANRRRQTTDDGRNSMAIGYRSVGPVT